MEAITRKDLLKKKTELRAEFATAKQKVEAARQSVRDGLAVMAELQGKYRMIRELLGEDPETEETEGGEPEKSTRTKK